MNDFPSIRVAIDDAIESAAADGTLGATAIDALRELFAPLDTDINSKHEVAVYVTDLRDGHIVGGRPREARAAQIVGELLFKRLP